MTDRESAHGEDGAQGGRHPGHRRPTLADVAEVAGVSTATVSRFFSSPEAVSSALRGRVGSAVKKLEYVPDASARALVTGRTNTLGFVVPTLDVAPFAAGVQAFQSRLAAADYTSLMAYSNYDLAEEARQVRALIARGVDGIVMVGIEHAPGLTEFLVERNVPFVNTWVFEPASEHPCIGFDNSEAMRKMARYVLDMGHRDIAIIVGGLDDENDRARGRIEGLRRAMAERGLALPPERVVERRYGVTDGRDAFRQLMAVTSPPTAILCTSDVYAIGALLECHRMGIGVPEEISITGFDDLEISRHMNPPLTAVNVPAAEMGRLAAEYLLARIADQPAAHLTELDSVLSIRGTVAPPPVRTGGPLPVNDEECRSGFSQTGIALASSSPRGGIDMARRNEAASVSACPDRRGIRNRARRCAT